MSRTELTHQLSIIMTTTDKPTTTTKEKLIIVSTKNGTITPTQICTTIPRDEFITKTSNLVETSINTSITTPIKTHTITQNVIRTNMVFAVLTNILK